MNKLNAPVPVILRPIQPRATHVHLEKHDGKPAMLTAISRTCGPDGEFYCEIDAPGYLAYPWSVSAMFLETVSGRSFCDIRDEAFGAGAFAPQEVDFESIS